MQEKRKCRVCGRTENNCQQCVEKTGSPCHWVEDDLCGACKTTVISFTSIKGGTGKTHIAILLAKCLAAAGIKVLMIDSDLNNSLSYFFLTEEMLNIAVKRIRVWQSEAGFSGYFLGFIGMLIVMSLHIV